MGVRGSSQASRLAGSGLSRCTWIAGVCLGLVAASAPHPCHAAEPLGIHVHHQAHAEAAARVGYGAVRLWDTGTDWASVEPQRGVLRLDLVRTRLATAERFGQRVILTLGGTPAWASSRPWERCAYGWGCAAPPSDLADWRRYVRRVATEFAGRIECYETWNEVSFPDDPVLNARSRNGGGDRRQFYSGTAAELVALQRAAYEEIRAADPAACVLSPSFHSSGEWFGKLDRFLEEGGAKWFDRLSFHFYTGEHPPERTLTLVQGVRAVLAKHSRGDVEIWNTEIGHGFSPRRSGESSADFRARLQSVLLRTYLANFGAGVRRVYWYAWDHGAELGLFRQARNAGPEVEAAARATVAFLRGLKAAQCPEANVDGRWRCVLHWRDGRSREVLWATGGADEQPLISVPLSRP